MSDNDRPTGVTLIAILFVISAIPSLFGTVQFIIEGLVPLLESGFGDGLLVTSWAYLLGIVATLFYGVIALAAGYGLWLSKSWARSLGMFLSVFLLFAIPVGTIIGAVIIWYLHKQEVRDTFVESFTF